MGFFFFLGFVLIMAESGSRMGEGKRRCRSRPWDGGDRRGAQGTFPYLSRDGSEGGEQLVHTRTGVANVTEKHFFLVKGTLTHLTLCIIRGGAGRGGDEDGTGP